MTNARKSSENDRRSTRDFLFSHAETEGLPKNPLQRPAVGLKELSMRFPDLLTGRAFVEEAVNRLETSIQFGVMLIRLDRFNETEDAVGPEYATRLLLDAAGAVDRICEPEGAIWGLIERDLFGCFMPETPDMSCLDFANEIRAELASHREETLTIGITEYPLFQFSRIETLKNARKALEHAAYSGPGGTAVFDADSLNINADRLYQRGDIESAITEYKTALLLAPSSLNLHNSLGVCYAALGAFHSALEEFETACRIDPKEAMPVYNAGLVFRMMGRKDKALARFLEAEQLEENLFEICFQIAKTYHELERIPRAAAYFEKSIGLKPFSAVAHRFLGDCHTALDRVEEAVAAYKKAVKLNPNDAASISALGLLFDQLGENPEIAILFCRHSVEIAPENGLFRQRLARLYLKHDRLDEALAEFESATRLGWHAEEAVQSICSRQTHRAS